MTTVKETKPRTSPAAVSQFSREEQSLSVPFSSHLLSVLFRSPPSKFVCPPLHLEPCSQLHGHSPTLLCSCFRSLLHSSPAIQPLMPQLPLLCLHQGEPCLLPERILSAPDCTHCDREHQDKFPPDINQCSSAGVIQDCKSEKMVTKEYCSLISSTQVRSDRTSYLLAQNQQEATFTPCMVQQWSSLPQGTANRAMGHLPE